MAQKGMTFAVLLLGLVAWTQTAEAVKGCCMHRLGYSDIWYVVEFSQLDLDKERHPYSLCSRLNECSPNDKDDVFRESGLWRWNQKCTRENNVEDKPSAIDHVCKDEPLEPHENAEVPFGKSEGGMFVPDETTGCSVGRSAESAQTPLLLALFFTVLFSRRRGKAKDHR